jgi:hypothetical protein
VKVLVACEFSGVVREAFRRRGHDAWSCDLLEAADGSSFHLRGDVREWLERGPGYDSGGWDLMLAHPPCTYLCGSGLHWNKRRPERAQKTADALAFVQELLNAPIPKICVENPVGLISTKIRPADQYIQPYQFGHDASKKTGLWLKGLPLLQPLQVQIKPRLVKGRPRWGNQTDSGQNKLGPSADRWALRSVTYQGIAEAMASQWG